MIVIGERVNATRKSIREAIVSRNADGILSEIRMQDEAGAEYIDLNAGTGSGDMDQESTDLCWLIDIALAGTEKKFTLDSASPMVLRNAAEHLADRREWMINSIKAESDGSMEEGLDLASEHKVPVVALAMDKDGIPRTTNRRMEICSFIHEAAMMRGVKEEQLFFDPLVLPISADVNQGKVTFETIDRIKKEFPAAHVTMGLSNVSHGLKQRMKVNSAFLQMAILCGLDSAICDPSKPDIRKGILLGELLMGRDRHCRRFMRALRSGVFNDEKGGAA